MPNYVYATRATRSGTVPDIKDARTGESVVSKATLLSKRDNTASGARAYHLALRGQRGFIVVKEMKRSPRNASWAGGDGANDSHVNDQSATTWKKEMRGLAHEKRVYDIVNALVDLRVCPFFVKRVVLQREPAYALATTSFPIGRYMSLANWLDKPAMHPKTPSAAIAFVFELLYALEVLWRVGVRHNDLHTKNVLMAATPAQLHGGLRRYEYVPRAARANARVAYTDIDVPVLPYEPVIFDMDRAFKFAPSNSRVRVARPALNTTPVTDRWHWHDPKFGVGAFDMHKVLQYVRRELEPGAVLRTVLETCFKSPRGGGGASVCVTLSRADYDSAREPLNRSWVDKYMIPLNERTDKETVPRSIWREEATPDFFILRLREMLSSSAPLKKNRRVVDRVSMRPLYERVRANNVKKMGGA